MQHENCCADCRNEIANLRRQQDVLSAALGFIRFVGPIVAATTTAIVIALLLR